MKKILVALIFVMAFGCAGWGQNRLYIGGSVSEFYKEHVQVLVQAHAGLEFSERVAGSGSVGIGWLDSYGDKSLAGVLGAVARYNVLNLGELNFDVKAKAEMAYLFQDGEVGLVNIGFVPSARYRLSEHLDVFGDVGFAGLRYFENAWKGCWGFNNFGVSLGINYRF